MAIDGKWRLTIETPMGVQTPVLTLKQDGDALTGALSTGDGAAPVTDPKLNGRTLTFSLPIKKPMPLTLSFSAEIHDDNTLSGKVKFGLFGGGAVKGEPLS